VLRNYIIFFPDHLTLYLHKIIFLSAFTVFGAVSVYSQTCPENIDFEKGNFDGWKCYIGSVAEASEENIITLSLSGGPVPNRQTMYADDGTGKVDPFGGFPINCPNGSGYSIKLGNDEAGTQAEGISYEFTIPSDRDEYSLIYHYALVLEDPNHLPYQQPRFEVEILNVTDNEVITCSSFTFFASGSLLPGFFLSQNPNDTTPVWCKDWSAVSINLNGNAGKTIRLFFKTADCTFRKHFGYAYIDVNSECSSDFTGSAFCQDDTLVKVVAPYGYESYTWYNNNFTSVLGSAQTLTIYPPPPSGTMFAVQVSPYFGYGCTDTLFVRLKDTLSIKAFAGNDIFTCNDNKVPLGGNAKPGLTYLWTPSAGLTNPNISNPFASPDTTTRYILSVTNSGGGCLSTDTVIVSTVYIDSSLKLTGKDIFCEGYGDSAVLHVRPTDSIQWYRNDLPISGSDYPNYRVTKSGTYYASLFVEEGCSKTTRKQDIVIEKERPGIMYPVEYAVINLPLTLQARQFGTSVVWSPATNLDDVFSYTPVFNGRTDQTYTIEIRTVTGCVTVDTQVIKSVENVEIYVPNGFTPNNDGKNDRLSPILMGIKDLRYFRVYNRWGQVMFESKSAKPGWDGTYNGVRQQSQVFVWMVEGTGLDGKLYRRKGTTVLIR
jgi:gliding motility-associated-like protein